MQCGWTRDKPPDCRAHDRAIGVFAMSKMRIEVWWLLKRFLTALVIAWLAACQRAGLCRVTGKMGT